MKKIIIAVDGHSSCGKSTLAKDLADALYYLYLDSGAMYRAVTLYALRKGLAGEDRVNDKELVRHMPEIRIDFRHNVQNKKNDTWLNGENVEEEIRRIEVSRYVSPVATIPGVRQELVRQQQQMGKNKGIVMDGRDIGTVVFPDAELKLFMTAGAEVRARRRYDELKAKGQHVSYTEILNNVSERDRIDSGRTVSPLRQAEDALVLDNSSMNRQEQLAWALQKVEEIVHEHES
ncbi:MAG: (d)CMP kinase [Mangrovibacterium sp.]